MRCRVPLLLMAAAVCLQGQAQTTTLAQTAAPALARTADSPPSYRIQLQRPIAELRALALAAEPPHEAGLFRQPDLVELIGLDPTLHLDVRYATANNFVGAAVYSRAQAFLQRPAALALLDVSRELRAKGYGLVIFDGYRPWFVTQVFWLATPPAQRQFVSDPAKGSRHNRGCAVDLALYDLRTGLAVPMPSGYDEMTERAYPDYPGGTAEERANRDLLRHTMQAHGFTVYEAEWWHFDYKDWKSYPILNRELGSRAE